MWVGNFFLLWGCRGAGVLGGLREPGTGTAQPGPGSVGGKRSPKQDRPVRNETLGRRLGDCMTKEPGEPPSVVLVQSRGKANADRHQQQQQQQQKSYFLPSAQVRRLSRSRWPPGLHLYGRAPHAMLLPMPRVPVCLVVWVAAATPRPGHVTSGSQLESHAGKHLLLVQVGLV